MEGNCVLIFERLRSLALSSQSSSRTILSRSKNELLCCEGFTLCFQLEWDGVSRWSNIARLLTLLLPLGFRLSRYICIVHPFPILYVSVYRWCIGANLTFILLERKHAVSGCLPRTNAPNELCECSDYARYSIRNMFYGRS